MPGRFWLMVTAVVLLSACASYKGFSYDPATGRAHTTADEPPETITIDPVGRAEIRRVNGRRVIIGGQYSWNPRRLPYPDERGKGEQWLEDERNHRQEYWMLKGGPGRYELEVGFAHFEARQAAGRRHVSDAAQRLTPFDAEPGRDYRVKILTFEDGVAKRWVAVVVSDGNERIVAALDGLGLLLGMDTRRAIAVLEGTNHHPQGGAATRQGFDLLRESALGSGAERAARTIRPRRGRSTRPARPADGLASPRSQGLSIGAYRASNPFVFVLADDHER